MDLRRFEPVAIVGLSCRFAGAADPAAFWRMLEGGFEFSDTLASRKNLPSGNQTLDGKSRVGFLEDIGRWDTAFLRLSESEARQADPRQLLMLELAREALEDAGQLIENLRGSATGIFWGAMWGAAGNGARVESGELSMIAGRTSQHYSFRGPSAVVDTATSSSLVAVHLACQALRCGDATLALAGGVNLFGPDSAWQALESLGVLAPDGIARPFDVRASGYVRSEGAGAVVLKLLDQAVRDGDRVYCVILASAVNHNGETPSIAAPSVEAQEELLETAYSRASVPATAVAYVEAHGTGTRRGDEAEWHALTSFVSGKRKSPLLIGSVKANVGHAEGAAGIAGLIKVALSAHHGLIPATIHVSQQRFSSPDVSVCTKPTVWPADSRVAGVTSLGLNGSNCHLVIERASNNGSRSPSVRPPWLFVMSAHTAPALVQYAQALLRWAEDEEWTDADLPHICYTAAARREHWRFRYAFLCSTISEFVDELRSFIEGSRRSTVVPEALEPVLRAFREGRSVHWESVFQETGVCVSLPPFPWQREQMGATSRAILDSDELRIMAIVADVLHVPVDKLEKSRSLIDLGLESLSAGDLESRLTEEFGVQLEAFSLLEATSVNDLIRQVVRVADAAPSHS